MGDIPRCGLWGTPLSENGSSRHYGMHRQSENPSKLFVSITFPVSASRFSWWRNMIYYPAKHQAQERYLSAVAPHTAGCERTPGCGPLPFVRHAEFSPCVFLSTPHNYSPPEWSSLSRHRSHFRHETRCRGVSCGARRISSACRKPWHSPC